MDENAVVGDSLGEIVFQIVVCLDGSRTRVQRKKTFLVDDEVVLVVMFMLCQSSPCREQAVGGIWLPTGAHDELAEAFEMSCFNRAVFQLRHVKRHDIVNGR